MASGDGGAGPAVRDDLPLLTPVSGSSGHRTAAPPTASAVGSIEELEVKCAPYVRRDAYGVMGQGELAPGVKALLLLAAVTILPIRLVAGVLVLVVYYVMCRVCTLFAQPRADGSGVHLAGWRQAVVAGSGRVFARVMLFVFGFYWIRVIDKSSSGTVERRRVQPEELERPGAIVSNHVSYVDILYHVSAFFPSFVAKRSVGKLPMVGLISECVGCIFVQREEKSVDVKGVSGLVTERVREAHCDKHRQIMLLFPEGTTTNGDYLLPFKKGAFLARAPVRPVLLRYPYKKFSPAWESMSGARHLFLLLCQFVNHLEVVHLPVYYPSEEEQDDPNLYANNVRKLMALEGNLILSDIGLPEKRVYLAALNDHIQARDLRQKGD